MALSPPPRAAEVPATPACAPWMVSALSMVTSSVKLPAPMTSVSPAWAPSTASCTVANSPRRLPAPSSTRTAPVRSRVMSANCRDSTPVSVSVPSASERTITASPSKEMS